MPARIGGGGKSYFFRLSADHSSIYADLSGEVAATTPEDAALILGGDSGEDIITETGHNFNDDGSVEIGYQQTQFDEELWTFLKVAAPRTVTASEDGVNEEVSETGDKKLGGDSASGSAQPFLVITYGKKSTDGKVPVFASVMTFKKSSGGFTYTANQYVKPPLTAVSMAAKDGGS
ncbi:MAG: hypothetical protein ACLFQX_08180, partial [Candidatus Kapaibacterium sp.]